MTINYKGMSKDYEYRIAEISWDSDDEKENTLAGRLANFMIMAQGYDMEIVTDGYAIIEVADFSEYQQVVAIYKQAKKMFLQCMKFGF